MVETWLERYTREFTIDLVQLGRRGEFRYTITEDSIDTYNLVVETNGRIRNGNNEDVVDIAKNIYNDEEKAWLEQFEDKYYPKFQGTILTTDVLPA